MAEEAECLDLVKVPTGYQKMAEYWLTIWHRVIISNCPRSYSRPSFPMRPWISDIWSYTQSASFWAPLAAAGPLWSLRLSIIAHFETPELPSRLLKLWFWITYVGSLVFCARNRRRVPKRTSQFTGVYRFESWCSTWSCLLESLSAWIFGLP